MRLRRAIAVVIAAIGVALLGSLIILSASFMLVSGSNDVAAVILLLLIAIIFGVVLNIVVRDMLDRFTR